MIILCTRCQAKFRVADEKIGPRGAKVRCSKCSNVFAVHRDAGALPSSAPPAPPPAARRGPPLPEPSAAVTARTPEIELESRSDRGRRSAARRPPVAPPPLPAIADDPFAAVRGPDGDPFLATRAAAADPFAAPPGNPDPFAPAGGGSGAPGFDPRGAFDATLGDPFVAAVVPRAAAPARHEPPPSLVTDLSDLLGAATTDPGAAPAAPPGTPPGLELDRGSFDASALVGPESGPALDTAGHFPDGGLALETPDEFPDVGLELDRSRLAFPPQDAPAPVSGSPSPGSAMNVDFGGAAVRFEDEAATSAPWPGPEMEIERGDVRPPDPAPASEPKPEPEARSSATRRSAVRKLALNAVSLAALLFLSVALLVMWRGGGSVSAALRSTPMLAGLAGAPADATPFPARDLSSGLFDRAEGAPILYVHGTITSHAPAAVAGVRVSVEILRGDAVVARGEALAGAVPTPEDLHAVRDAADLSRRAGEWTRRAPVRVGQGDALPFLVAMLDVPADLTGTTVRVSAAAVEPES